MTFESIASKICHFYAKNILQHPLFFIIMVMKIACAPILNSESQIALFCKSACSFAPYIH